MQSGFVFDEHLALSDQIFALSKSCYSHIRELRCIRPYVDLKTASTIATSIVHSKLDFTASVCDGASTVGAAFWGGECGGPRHCCIRWGSTSCKRKVRFWGLFFPIFTMGNAIRSTTVKCSRFVCEKLTTFLFSKHITGKLDSWAFWQYIQFEDQSWGL